MFKYIYCGKKIHLLWTRVLILRGGDVISSWITQTWKFLPLKQSLSTTHLINNSESIYVYLYNSLSLQFFVISTVVDLLTSIPAFKLFLQLTEWSFQNTNQIMSSLSLKPLQQLLTACRIKLQIFSLASKVLYDLQQPVTPTLSPPNNP